VIVGFIDGSTFAQSRIDSFSVEPVNRRFAVFRYFLFGLIELAAMRLHGRGPPVYLLTSTDVLDSVCFYEAGIETLILEIKSQCIS
jgi:hypothetical protein